jgi:hypothetical protein
MTREEVITKFVCPGCVCGSSTNDTCYEPVTINWKGSGYYCKRHVCGTTAMPGGTFALGLPKGFNKVGYAGNGLLDSQRNNTILIRCWLESNRPEWDDLNVAVWALEQDGFLFVRTYQPRINFAAVDIIENGELSLVPQAIDVGNFIDEID